MSLSQEVSNDGFKDNLPKESPSECEADFFGPVLPPRLLKKQSAESEKIYGPMLPDNFSEKEKLESDAIALSASDVKDKILIGPEIPEYLKPSTTAVSKVVDEENEPLVTDDCFDDDDGNFGPSTTLMATGNVTNYYQFNSSQSKNKKDAGETSVKRESWMTELPQKKAASFGLLPRHFKSRNQTEKESDSSVWTDTPADKDRKKNLEKKKDHKDILKMKRLQERDKEMEKLARKAAKKLRKKESLLELHMKNMKKKEKKEIKKREKASASESLPVRRPFDRNVDLQIRKFDENHKRAILNKSQFLNDRFASGESKFL